MFGVGGMEGMHPQLASLGLSHESLLKIDPHFNPTNHPFSISNIINNAENKAELKLYEMQFAQGYGAPVTPPQSQGNQHMSSDSTLHGSAPAESNSYNGFHPSLYQMYQTPTSL